jgi:cobalt-zinc-cadmium efflux system protein
MHARDHAGEFGAVRSGLIITAILCVAELIGGWLTNSLALMSDAAHMFTDVAALALTLFAIWICSRGASETKTFGYYRAEILAALVNGVALWVIVVFIVAEAWRRLHDPPVVAGGGMLAIAATGLAANVVVVLRLRAHRHDSLNLRGAYLHVLSDLLGSVGAVLAGVVIVVTGWTAADAVASALIAVLILASSWFLVREAVDVLMEAVPAHIDVDALRPLARARPRHRRGPRPPRLEPHDRSLCPVGARRRRGRPRRGRRHPRRDGGRVCARLPHRPRDDPDRAREPPRGRARALERPETRVSGRDGHARVSTQRYVESASRFSVHPASSSGTSR